MVLYLLYRMVLSAPRRSFVSLVSKHRYFDFQITTYRGSNIRYYWYELWRPGKYE